MKKTLKASTSKPHVKWGSLAFSVISILVDIAFIALNIYANTGKLVGTNLGLAFAAAYGWILGFVFLLAGGTYFFESFLPSYKKAKNWKNYEAYKDSVVKATRASLLSNYRKDATAYAEFLSNR